MTTETTFAPIVDPETGEILAANEADRRELIDLYADDLVREAMARAKATRARRALGLLMRVGDAWAGGDGWGVMVKPPGTPPRQVVQHAIDEHAESLRPIHLAPVEDTRPRPMTYPKVSDLTSKASREALARLGLTPEQFLHQPEPGDPQIVVVPPEGSG